MNNLKQIISWKESLFMVPSFFILFLFLASCTAKYAEGIERYAYKECYRLDKNEKMVAIDSIVSEKYAPIFELGKHQIPLNRAFKNNQYETYIGLALNSTSDGLYNDHLKSDQFKVIKHNVTKKQYHLFFSTKENMYVYRMIYNEPVKKIVVVMNFVSDNKDIINEMYEKNETFLPKKMSCEKK